VSLVRVFVSSGFVARTAVTVVVAAVTAVVTAAIVVGLLVVSVTVCCPLRILPSSQSSLFVYVLDVVCHLHFCWVYVLAIMLIFMGDAHCLIRHLTFSHWFCHVTVACFPYCGSVFFCCSEEFVIILFLLRLLLGIGVSYPLLYVSFSLSLLVFTI
jgi:hypothetical protein